MILYHLTQIVAAVTPSPEPSTEPPGFNEDTVTPGVVGFIVTFLVAVAVIVLIVDMVRRVRRVNYRAQARAKIEQEEIDKLEEDLNRE
jgi:hypothetical protein